MRISIEKHESNYLRPIFERQSKRGEYRRSDPRVHGICRAERHYRVRYIHRPRAFGKDGQSPRIPADDQRQLSQAVRYRACLETRPFRPQPLRLRLLQEYSQKERRKGHIGKGEHLRRARRRAARIDA